MYLAARILFCSVRRYTNSSLSQEDIVANQKLVLQVAKEDISVRFYEEQDGQIVWEGYGDFQHTNVHKQVAISFRTPRYKSLEIDNQVKVMWKFPGAFRNIFLLFCFLLTGVYST